MTATAKVKPSVMPAEALLGQDRDLFKQLLKESLQEVLEAEMTEVIGASSGERTELRSGYRAGYYSRSLVTRIGKLELRIPRDREGQLLHRAVRPLPALGDGAGVGPGRDVRAGRVDPQGQGGDRGAVRARGRSVALSANQCPGLLSHLRTS